MDMDDILLTWTQESEYWQNEEIELDREIVQLESGGVNKKVDLLTVGVATPPSSSPNDSWFAKFKTAAKSSGNFIKQSLVSRETYVIVVCLGA